MKLALIAFLILFSKSAFGQLSSGYDISKQMARNVVDVCFADLNGDGLEDIIAAGGQGCETTLDYPNCSIGREKICWFKNLGNNDYSQRIDLSIEKYGATKVEVDDFDGDGDLDIFFSDYEFFETPFPYFIFYFNCGLYILVNNGDGDFSEKIPILENYNSPLNFLLTDANFDNKKDIILRTRVLKNDTLFPHKVIFNTEGNFTQFEDLPIINNLIIDDISLNVADSSVSIACITNNNGNDSVLIYTKNQDTILLDQVYFVDENLSKAEFFDITNDGKEDLIYTVFPSSFYYSERMVNQTWSIPSLFLQNNGTTNSFRFFKNELNENFLVTVNTAEVKVIRFDDDISYNTIDSVLFYIIGGGVSEVSYEEEFNKISIAITLQSDAIRLLLFENEQFKDTTVLLALENSRGTFYALEDLNSDELIDVILNRGFWYQNLGNDSFSVLKFLPNLPNYTNQFPFFSDLNQDGFNDIIFTDSLGAHFSYGNINFDFSLINDISIILLENEDSSKYLAYIDLDNNNTKELLVVSYIMNAFTNEIQGTIIRVYSYNLQIQQFNFLNQSVFPNTYLSNYLNYNQLNSFSSLNLFSARIGYGNLIKLVNAGDFSFTLDSLPGNYSFYFFNENNNYNYELNDEFSIVDFNNDGIEDVVYLGSSTDGWTLYVNILLSNPNNQTYENINLYTLDYFSLSSFVAMTCADINYDGYYDILINGLDTPKLFYLENEGDNLNFNMVIIDSTYGGFKNIEAKDMDGDNDFDFICGGGNRDYRLVYYANKKGKPVNSEFINKATEINVWAYPNPTDNVVTIKSNSTLSQCSIYDISGRQLIEFNLNSNEFTLNRDLLNSGINIVKVVFKETQEIKYLKIFAN